MVHDLLPWWVGHKGQTFLPWQLGLTLETEFITWWIPLGIFWEGTVNIPWSKVASFWMALYFSHPNEPFAKTQPLLEYMMIFQTFVLQNKAGQCKRLSVVWKPPEPITNKWPHLLRNNTVSKTGPYFDLWVSQSPCGTVLHNLFLHILFSCIFIIVKPETLLILNVPRVEHVYITSLICIHVGLCKG